MKRIYHRTVNVNPARHAAQSHQGTDTGNAKDHRMGRNSTKTNTGTTNLPKARTRAAPRSNAKAKDPGAPVFIPKARGRMVELENGDVAIIVPREVLNSTSTTLTKEGTGINLGRFQVAMPIPEKGNGAQYFFQTQAIEHFPYDDNSSD